MREASAAPMASSVTSSPREHSESDEWLPMQQVESFYRECSIGREDNSDPADVFTHGRHILYLKIKCSIHHTPHTILQIRNRMYNTRACSVA